MYGVSPQPAHAPENSISGSSNCTSLTCEWDRRLRSNSGMDRKNSQFWLSGSRSGACAAMLMALVLGLALVLRGTHLNAESTTCAVFWRNLQGVSQILKFAPAR